MKFSLLVVGFLIPLLFTNPSEARRTLGTGVHSGAAGAGALTGSTAAVNAKEMKKRQKECKAGKKSSCPKATAHGGQMLGDLMKMAMMALTAAAAGSGGGGDSGNSIPESEFRAAIADPLVFADPEKAERLLSGTPLSAAEKRDIVEASQLAADNAIDLDEAAGVIRSATGDVSIASLNSAAGMKSLGFTQSEIDELKSEYAAVAERAEEFKMAKLSTDGGGGPSGPKKNRNEEEFDYSLPKLPGYEGGVKDVIGDRSNRVWSRSFGGEQIGIQKSDMFRTVSARYQKKRAINLFLP